MKWKVFSKCEKNEIPTNIFHYPTQIMKSFQKYVTPFDILQSKIAFWKVFCTTKLIGPKTGLFYVLELKKFSNFDLNLIEKLFMLANLMEGSWVGDRKWRTQFACACGFFFVRKCGLVKSESCRISQNISKHIFLSFEGFLFFF